MNQLDIIKYGHLTLTHTLDAFPENGWYKSGACGYWSVKDIIAHLASYELALADLLASLISECPTPYLNEFIHRPKEYNDEQVNRRSEDAMEKVLSEYNTAFDRVQQSAAQVPDDLWIRNGILAWYGPGYDLQDFVVYSFYGHKREHAAQIAAFTDILTR